MALLNAITRGSGAPPLVFVHGFACGLADWDAQVAHFAPRHQVIAVDLPGHGKTPAAEGSVTVPGCGAAVAAFLREEKVPPAVLVGHSMGCRVVLEAARLAPEHVAALVLVDGSRFAASSIPALKERFAAGGFEPVARGMFEQMFTERSDAAARAAVIARALKLPAKTGETLLLSLAAYDVERLEAALAAVRAPLHLLQTTTVDDSRQRRPLQPGETRTPFLDYYRARVPAARVEVMAGVGHFPQIDVPAETNRAIEAFIATLR